jgi:hypothetical protein
MINNSLIPYKTPMKKLLLVSIILLHVYALKAQMAPNYITTPHGFVPLVGDEVTVDLIGAASLAGNADEGLGQGASGISFYKTGKYQGSVVFSLASNSEIDFSGDQKEGSKLLVPGNGAGSLQLDFRTYSVFKNPMLGLNFSLIAASGNWIYQDESYNVSPVSFRGQLSGKILDQSGDKLNILLTTDLGITYRGFLGDASNDDALKLAIFGTDQSHFIGAELNVDLWLNDTHFFFSLPYLVGDDVKGLTGGQIILGAVVSGKVIKNVLKL